MKKTLLTKPHLEYIRELRNLLPKEAFSCDRKKLRYLLLYFVIILIAYCLFRFTHNLIVYSILACLIAHSLSCIGFLAHDLSHHSIIKNRRPLYILEVISWGINLIPATLWDRIHNQAHHTQSNTVKDPDRQYFISEMTPASNLYTKVFYPNKRFMKWNPLVAFHFIPYIFRNIISVFYLEDSKPAVVPFKPKYSTKQKAKIIMELMVIATFQIGIFNLVGKNALAYLFAGPLSYLLTSSILMMYIFTNHFLNPVTEQSDPVLGTTTVEVPNLLNRVHFNFAYHTEHHLFPSMNSEFYPQLSTILREKYSDRYNYLHLKDAWKKLWKNDDFISFKTDKTGEDVPI